MHEIRGTNFWGTLYLENKDFGEQRFSSVSALECGLSCGWDDGLGSVKEANRRRVHLDWEKIVQICDMCSITGASRVNLESEVFGRWWFGRRRAKGKVNKDTLWWRRDLEYIMCDEVSGLRLTGEILFHIRYRICGWRLAKLLPVPTFATTMAGAIGCGAVSTWGMYCTSTPNASGASTFSRRAGRTPRQTRR